MPWLQGSAASDPAELSDLLRPPESTGALRQAASMLCNAVAAVAGHTFGPALDLLKAACTLLESPQFALALALQLRLLQRRAGPGSQLPGPDTLRVAWALLVHTIQVQTRKA